MNSSTRIGRVTARGTTIAAGVLVAVGAVHAQAPAAAGPAKEDHRAVIELGLAAERGIGESSTGLGGTIAVEMTPIENWLELETGVAAMRSAGHTEYSADFLFKKPWQLSEKAEFMAGLGPELSHRPDHRPGTTLATEIIGDFMFWPTRNVGWYLEPGYSMTRLSGGERSVELSAGLIIGVP